MDKKWNNTDRVNLKYSERNLPQCYFILHKSYMYILVWDRTSASAVRCRRQILRNHVVAANVRKAKYRM